MMSGDRGNPILSLTSGCALVVLWFLWPFAGFSLMNLVYALFAGSALFLCAWFCALAALPRHNVNRVVQVAAVAVAALVIGFAADVGSTLAMQNTGQGFADRLLARALDAGFCALAAGLVQWLDGRFLKRSI